MGRKEKADSSRAPVRNKSGSQKKKQKARAAQLPTPEGPPTRCLPCEGVLEGVRARLVCLPPDPRARPARLPWRRFDWSLPPAAHRRGAFADQWQLAAFYWGRLVQAMEEDDGAWGEPLLELNLHVRPPDARNLRRINPGGWEGARRGEYNLGWLGPMVGGNAARWDSWRVETMLLTKRIYYGAYCSRILGRWPTRCPWPRPPPGFSGPLKELPRRGCAIFLHVLPRGEGLRVDLQVWNVLEERDLFEEGRPRADLPWDSSGLLPGDEADRLADQAERIRRYEEEGTEDEEEDDLPYLPDDDDFYSSLIGLYN